MATDRAVAHHTALAAVFRRPTHPARVPAWLASIPAEQLLTEAQALAREVALLKGFGHTPQSGSHFLTSTLGDAEVLVEYDYEGESGDGWNEPHYGELATILGALVNGVWVDTDCIAAKVVERWEEEAIGSMQSARDDDAEDRAEARHRDMMERVA
jgi:hypothetical protein